MRLPALSFAALLLVARTALAHDVAPPKVVDAPSAAWPPGHAEHHDMVVPVLLVVEDDGHVGEASVESSVGHGFDEAAIAAVKQWRFVPATRDGKNVAAKIRVVVRFAGHVHAAEPAPAAAPPADAPSAAPAAPSAPGAAPSAAPEAPKEGPEAVRVTGKAPPRSASEIVRERDVLGAAPHRTASDLLTTVPGVFVTQHSGEGKAHQIFMRGFDAVHGQDVELWVGGIPVNEVSNIHGQGYADLHFVMPEVVREVRAIPGPFDPHQGDFAVAGTVQMKLGLAEPGLQVKGTLGSFGARRLFLAYHPKGQSDETFAAFEEYRTDGFGPSRSAHRGSLIAQGTHDFGSDVSLRALVTVSSGRFDSAGVLRARDVDSGKVDLFSTPGSVDAPFGPQGGSSARTQFALDLHKDDENARWSLAPFLVFRSLSLRQNFTGYFVDAVRGDNTEQVNDSVIVGATASYKRTFKIFQKDDSIEAGLYGRNDEIDQSQRRFPGDGGASTATLVDAHVRATNVAGFVDMALHPLRRLVVRGGLRMDALAYATDDHASAENGRRTAQGAHLGKKITADFVPLSGLHLLASYGDGFRSPQARALANGESTPFTTVDAFEVGARYNQGKRFSGSFALYHTLLSQDLVFDPETARNEPSPGTKRFGATLEMTVRPTDWFTLAGSTTFTRASFREDGQAGGIEVKEGDLLPYVPQIVSRVDATARHTFVRLLNRDLEGRVGVGLESIVRRPLPYGELGRDVFLTDLSLAVRFKEIELGCDITNLLGARWYDGQFVYASNYDRSKSPVRVPAYHVTAGPPRAVFFNLSLTI